MVEPGAESDLRSEIEDLEKRLAALKQDLWIARDSAIGAIAELGTARARIVELETMVHQLHQQLASQDAIVRSRTYQLVQRLGRPIRVARRVVG